MKRIENLEASEFEQDVAELTAVYNNEPMGVRSTMPMTEPASPTEGDVWYDPAAGIMHAFIGAKWVTIS